MDRNNYEEGDLLTDMIKPNFKHSNSTIPRKDWRIARSKAPSPTYSWTKQLIIRLIAWNMVGAPAPWTESEPTWITRVGNEIYNQTNNAGGKNIKIFQILQN